MGIREQETLLLFSSFRSCDLLEFWSCSSQSSVRCLSQSLVLVLFSRQKWPSGPLAEFRDTQTSFFLRCKELSLRVLKVMAHSLDLDPELFLSAHRLVGSEF